MHSNSKTRKCEIVKLFDSGCHNLLPIEQWLNQTLIVLEKTNITIRDIIRSVADKDGGAHVDSKPNLILIKGAKMKINGQKGYIYYLMAIAKYVVDILPQIIEEQKNK